MYKGKFIYLDVKEAYLRTCRPFLKSSFINKIQNSPLWDGCLDGTLELLMCA